MKDQDGPGIGNLSDFLKELESVAADPVVLYRGQPEDLPLLPKIGRKSLSPQLQEADMIAAFKRQCVPFLSSLPTQPTNEWDWLALAQHHGMATRLLDWTKNPLAALWFAVAQVPVQGQNGVVWTFHPSDRQRIDVTVKKDGPLSENAVCYFEPSHVSPRIRAQEGCFTVQPETERPLEQTNGTSKRLKKIVIKASSFWYLRYQLDLYGLNESVLFPDLDGLCRHLTWNASLLSDEEGHLELGENHIWKISRQEPAV
jgi:hypothetical protein